MTAGLPTNALGSLVVDPNDASGNTLYAGTGEANAINQAGLGVYKTTDGGNSWSLVPGSFDVAKDRSVGAIAIDPTDPNTIWIGTAHGRQGQSSSTAARRRPPAHRRSVSIARPRRREPSACSSACPARPGARRWAA